MSEEKRTCGECKKASCWGFCTRHQVSSAFNARFKGTNKACKNFRSIYPPDGFIEVKQDNAILRLSDIERVRKHYEGKEKAILDVCGVADPICILESVASIKRRIKEAQK